MRILMAIAAWTLSRARPYTQALDPAAAMQRVDPRPGPRDIHGHAPGRPVHRPREPARSALAHSLGPSGLWNGGHNHHGRAGVELHRQPARVGLLDHGVS